MKITCVLWEANGERRLFDFLFKEILFVEEENDGGVREPLVVTNGIKQLQTLLHSVRRLVLVQNLSRVTS